LLPIKKSTASKTIFAIDPPYGVLWCFDVAKMKMLCFNIFASKSLGQTEALFKSDVALSNKNVMNVTRVQACLNVFACLDTLTFAENLPDMYLFLIQPQEEKRENSND
jgi:hypothetical protein